MPAVEATLRIAPRRRSDIAGTNAERQRDDCLDEHADLLELPLGVGLANGPFVAKPGVVDEDLDAQTEVLDPAGSAPARRGLASGRRPRALGADPVLGS